MGSFRSECLVVVLGAMILSHQAFAFGKNKPEPSPAPIPTASPTPSPTPEPSPSPVPVEVPGCALVHPEETNDKNCFFVLDEIFVKKGSVPDLPQVGEGLFSSSCFSAGYSSTHGTTSTMNGQLIGYIDRPAATHLDRYEKIGAPFIRDGMLYVRAHSNTEYGLKQEGDLLIFAYATRLSGGEVTYCVSRISKDRAFPASLPGDDLETLVKILRDSEQSDLTRASVLVRLKLTGQVGSALQALIEIVRSSQSDHWPLRLKTVSALCQSGDAGAQSFLLQALTQGDLPTVFNQIIIDEFLFGSDAGLKKQFESTLIKLVRDGRDHDILGHAIKRLGALKSKQAVLPLLDVAGDLLRAPVRTYDDKEIIEALHALGNIGSDRALPLLNNPALKDSENQAIRDATRAAIAKVELSSSVQAIREGNDPKAIEWGMNLIKFNDGSKRELIMKVLDAFESTLADPATCRQIAHSLRMEAKSGYHDYDQELVNRMLQVADVLAAR